MMYRRICVGLNTKGTLIPENEDIFKFVKNQKKDHYISLFSYNEEQKEKFYEQKDKIDSKTGEVIKTINGAKNINDVITNRLVFDFDDKHDLDQAKLDTIETVDRLIKLGFADDKILATFSGNKGFGVEVITDTEFTPEELKAVTKEIAGELKTFDSVIFNASRIIRIPFTKHQDSIYYKMPLMLEELRECTIVEIKDIAKEEYEPEIFTEIAETPSSVLTLKVKKIAERKEVIQMESDLDLSKKPRWLSNWKYAMQEGFFPEGSRNHSLMILGATYRGQAFNKITAYRMLKGAAELQSQRSGQERYADEQIWLEIIEQVYDEGWNGGTYSEDKFSDELVEFLEAQGISRGDENDSDTETLIENVSDGFDGFVEYANRIDEFTMKFGIPSLDDKLKVRKGHLIYLIAPPGVGKTSFAITLLNNMSKEKIGSYFGSYDMYKNNVYQKLLQRHTGLSEEAIYDVFRNGDRERIQKFRDTLEREYNEVSFCFKVGQSIQDLKDSVTAEEKKRGKPIELVVVDYLELILTSASDPTAASAEAAQGLRELANEGRVVFGLLQPNKMSSTPDEPLLSYNAAKGSSTIAQSGTAILTGHRPGMSSENNNENDHYFGLNCVKNRNGSLFSLDFGWDGKTQTIYEMEDIERMELNDLRKRKQDRKAMDSL